MSKLGDEEKRHYALAAVDQYMDSTGHKDSPFELISIGATDPENEKALMIMSVRIDAEHTAFMSNIMQGVAEIISTNYQRMLNETGNETDMIRVDPGSGKLH